jgi:putative tricarboxylic transport membrane protein
VRVNDAVFGAALLALAAAILWQASGFPAMPGQDYGPALFPSLMAAGLALCGAVLAVRGGRRLAAGEEAVVGVAGWEGGWRRLADAGLIVGGLAVWMLVWDAAGFLLGGTAYAAALMLRFRGRPLSSLGIALLVVLLIDWGFRRLLLVPLPLGPLTGIVW